MLAGPLHQLHRATDYLAARRIDRRTSAQEYWPAERILRLQQERLDALVRHAAANSPFYRDLYSDVDLQKPIDLASLPTTSKLQLMENFDRVVTDDRIKLQHLENHLASLAQRYYLGRYYVHAATGSSGHKGTYVFDRRERQTGLAMQMRHNRMAAAPLPKFRPRRYARFGSTPGMLARRAWGVDLSLRPVRRLTLDHRDSLRAWVDALNDFEPDTLWGVPSQIALLAAEQLDGRLKIGPEIVTTCGEVCTPAIQEQIQAAWGVRPFDDWGFSEGGGLVAGDCQYHRGLHLHWDVCLVEVVDEGNQPVAAGVNGDKLLITALNGYTLPRIRFEIPDFVALTAERCPCERTLPLISVAQGRSEDALYMPGLRGGEVLIHPMHFRGRIANHTGIKEYQVVYDGAALTVLAVLRDGAVADGIVEALSATLRESLELNEVVMPEIRVEIVDGDRIARDPAHRGKLKLVIDKRPRAAQV